MSLLDCFDLKQHVDCSTHIKGHTLDLVISNGSFLSQFSVMDLGLSDHSAIVFNMELSHSNIYPFRTVNYRKWKSIDLPDFSAFIESSLSGFSPSDLLEDNISVKFCSFVWFGLICTFEIPFCGLCTICSLV